jgi:hypothetical protein
MTGFHIHVDAVTLDAAFERLLVDQFGFWRSDFEGHPEGVEGFEPPHHLTYKASDSVQYRRVFDQVVRAAADVGVSMRGYVEGEFVASDEDIPWKPFDPAVPVPWTIESGRLDRGQFRESELHITMAREGTSPDLVRALRGMGFFSAYLRKSFGSAEVFTVQGSRADIASLVPSLRQFLIDAGGAAHCSLMEERVAGWWTSAPDVALPPVVTRVGWAG